MMARKGSCIALKWSEEEKKAFEALKAVLTGSLELFHINPDKPFVLRADASDRAIGAVLEQELDTKWVPVAFFSRKVGKVAD